MTCAAEAPPVPRPSDFTSRLRGPEVAARVGLWLGICFGICFVTGLISHFAQDTPGWLTVPDPAGLAVPRHPGPACASAAPPPSRCCWSSSGRSSPSCSSGSTSRRRRLALQWPSGLDRRARRGGDLPARHRTGQLGPVVPVGLLLPGHPLRGRLGRDRRPAGPHRRQAAAHPRRADRRRSTTTRRRTAATERAEPSRASCATTWLAAGVAVLGDRGRHRAAAARGLGLRRPVGRRPAGHPDQQERHRGRCRPRRPPSAGYRLALANGERTVELTRADLEAHAADDRDAADRVRRGLERVRASGAVCGFATCWHWSAPDGGDVEVESLQPSGTYRITELPRNSPTTTYAARARAQRRGAEHRPRLPVPADRARPAGCAADQMGRADRGARHEDDPRRR